jgi:thymidine phosphorylase
VFDKLNKDDKIDYSVGIKLNKLVEDNINKGDDLAIIYYNSDIPEFNIENIFKIN